MQSDERGTEGIISNHESRDEETPLEGDDVDDRDEGPADVDDGGPSVRARGRRRTRVCDVDDGFNEDDVDDDAAVEEGGLDYRECFSSVLEAYEYIEL